VIALRQTPEYEEFLQAFDRLGHAHRRVAATNRNRMDLEPINSSQQIPRGNRRGSVSPFSFLQHLAVDDVILRVFEFLECGEFLLGDVQTQTEQMSILTVFTITNYFIRFANSDVSDMFPIPRISPPKRYAANSLCSTIETVEQCHEAFESQGADRRNRA
jgi:hypothetical protein